MTQHTPTPLHTGLASELRDSHGRVLGVTYGGNKNQDAEARANACFIALSCNSHAELLTAAEAALQALYDAQGEWAQVTPTYAPLWTNDLKNAQQLLFAAIAKAKGESYDP